MLWSPVIAFSGGIGEMRHDVRIVFTDLWQGHNVSQVYSTAPLAQASLPISVCHSVPSVRSTLVPRAGEVYHPVYVHKVDLGWRHI